jgi:uncharacterized protein YkwD
MSTQIARAPTCVVTLFTLVALAGSSCACAVAHNSDHGTPPMTTASTSPCENAGTTPEAANIAAVEQATMCLVNQARSQHDMTALLPNTDLQETAEAHNNDMITDRYFAQSSPTGVTLLSRVRLTGYFANDPSSCLVGQDIAWGTGYLATPSAIVTSWTSSPAVLANILQPYTETGVAISAQVPASLSGGQPGATYTQDFGAGAPAAASERASGRARR